MAVDPYLGEMIGSIHMPSMQTIRLSRPRHSRFASNMHMVLAMIGVTVLVLIVALVVWVSFMFAAQPSLAHGPAEWIQRGGYKNAAGELCCGERDCFELTDADVKVTPAGYYIVSIKETIPFAEAMPSPDGRYWRCAWGGTRKCFFAPPGSS